MDVIIRTKPRQESSNIPLPSLSDDQKCRFTGQRISCEDTLSAFGHVDREHFQAVDLKPDDSDAVLKLTARDSGSGQQISSP